jgi:hypothetical protein
MNTARILSFILLPLLTFAQAPAPYPVLVDSQRATVPALEVFQANAITFRASFKSGNVANSIVTESPFMYWMPFGATNATVVTANWSIVSAPAGTVDFAFTPADLNFAAGAYSYQIGLEQSGGPQVIKQGSFTIKPSQASIGAEPVIFSTTNINWGSINWTGVPDFEYQTNTIAQVATLNATIATASNALSGQINTASNALNDRITTVSNSLFATSAAYSNALHTQIQAVNDASKWSQFQATQTVNMANNSITNAGNIQAVSINGDSSAISIPHIHGAIAGNVYIHIRNGTTNTIAKGTPVYVIGNVGAGDRKLVAPAQSSDPTKMPAIAVAEKDILAGEDGDGVILGEIRTYNTVTNAWTVNTELYVAALGGLTKTAPTNGLVQSVGQVSRTNNINGIIVAQIQGAVLPKESFLASTTTFVAVESDPIFAAVSNSINTRITAVETGKVNLSVYTPATQALWAAIGNAASADAALTNVTASGRITATKTGAQVALTFDASGLATGTPIYSVSGLATGAPLYVESDPIWSAASNLYATTAGVAAAYYPIGNPSNFITTDALTGYVTGDVIRVEADPVYAAASNTIFTRIIAVEGYTNLAASALSSSVWASADSTTNYASRITFNATSNALNTRVSEVEAYTSRVVAVEAYTNLAASALSSSVWASADSTTNYASRIIFNATSNSFNTRITAVEGYTNTAASALASSVWASADSTTNYQTRTGFISASNAINTRLVAVEGYTSRVVAVEAYTSRVVAVEGYTNRAALALESNVWASADSTTNYASRVAFVSVSNTVTALGTNVAARLASNEWAAADSTTNYASRIAFTSFTNSYATADATTNYALRTTFVTATNALDNKFTNFLQLAGGTVVGDLRVSRSTTASTTLTLTNSGSISTGLRIDLPASSTFLDLNGTNDKYTFTDTTANFHGNTITNAIVAGYLTVTGAAATYVNTTNLPAGIVTTNNLSTIAGSGLGVESNRLVVTNVPSAFETLTGNRFVLGNTRLTNIVTNALGATILGRVDSGTTISIGTNAHGASFNGWAFDVGGAGTISIGELATGASIYGAVGQSGSSTIGYAAVGAQQRIYTTGPENYIIGDFAHGASQFGSYGDEGVGQTARNDAIGALQLIGPEIVGAVGNYTTASNAYGSILLGPGTQTNAYGILAVGPIQSTSGFRGNAAGLTNFPSSILTVTAGNANYWRITTAPTGSTSSGSSGQMAVDGTNLFIYSPNALGVGTARWLRVNAEANW